MNTEERQPVNRFNEFTVLCTKCGSQKTRLFVTQLFEVHFECEDCGNLEVKY